MTKVYTGKPISLDLQEADVKNVLRLLADVSGANIVIEPDVGGKVTLKVSRVPWDQVLDMILAMNNLGQEQTGGVIRIARQDKLKKELGEREAEFKARQQVMETAKEMGDIATNYLQVNYAQAAKIATKIEKMKSAKGKVTVDDRTNLILYSDYPAYIQSARELLAKLDLPTPQVLIEGRIVQLNSSASRELGITWNFDSTSVNNSGVHQYLGNLAINHAVAATSTMGFGFGQILGQTLYNVDIQIQAAESAGKGKIVSAPRVLTLDNVEATIVQGTQIPYRKLSEFGVTTTEFKDATLELKVTPHITPDQKVRLEIKAKKEQPDFTQLVGADAAPAIQTRRVTTELLVADGDTIVIGGVIEDSESLNESRTPGLSQVPILGALFKNQRYQKAKNELLIFMSPRIANTGVPVRANRDVYGPSMSSNSPGRM
jgi:type IV pilus assembly protein PilQ